MAKRLKAGERVFAGLRDDLKKSGASPIPIDPWKPDDFPRAVELWLDAFECGTRTDLLTGEEFVTVFKALATHLPAFRCAEFEEPNLAKSKSAVLEEINHRVQAIEGLADHTGAEITRAAAARRALGALFPENEDDEAKENGQLFPARPEGAKIEGRVIVDGVRPTKDAVKKYLQRAPRIYTAFDESDTYINTMNQESEVRRPHDRERARILYYGVTEHIARGNHCIIMRRAYIAARCTWLEADLECFRKEVRVRRLRRLRWRRVARALRRRRSPK